MKQLHLTPSFSKYFDNISFEYFEKWWFFQCTPDVYLLVKRNDSAQNFWLMYLVKNDRISINRDDAEIIENHPYIKNLKRNHFIDVCRNVNKYPPDTLYKVGIFIYIKNKDKFLFDDLENSLLNYITEINKIVLSYLETKALL